MDSGTVYSKYLALSDHFPIWTTFTGKEIKLFDPLPFNHEIIKNKNIYSSPHENGRVPGEIVYSKEENILKVTCRDLTTIAFKFVKLKGKKLLNAHDFYNGFLTKHSKHKRLFDNNLVKR